MRCWRARPTRRSTPASSKCRESSDDADHPRDSRTDPVWFPLRDRHRRRRARVASTRSIRPCTPSTPSRRTGARTRRRARSRSRTVAGRAAARRPDRAQRQPVHPRCADDGVVAHARDATCRPTTRPWSARLERAGAIVVGKTNCDEFAMGSSTENSAFGPDAESLGARSHSRRHRAVDRLSPVAARLSPVALGSDTGGSIRQPAALCGVVGPQADLRSRVALRPDRAFASSLDQIGPLAHTAYDAAMTLNVIAGADAADATSSSEPVPDYTAGLTGEVRGLRIGVPASMLESGVDDEVLRAFRAGARYARRDEAPRWSTIELPHAKHAIGVYYLIATAEASSNLARYDGVRYGFRAPGSKDGELKTHVRADARDGIRPRGEAAHHARHLRPERRLLRRLLPESAAGAHADCARLRSCVRARRCRGDADEPDGRVHNRRTRRRPVADVSGRRVHGERESRRPAGDQRSRAASPRTGCPSDCS